MNNANTPSGPGPLIWLVILFGAVAGLIWGIGIGISVAVATIVVFCIIGNVQMKSEERKRERRAQEIRDEYRRKHGRELPPLTDEVRGVFDRMMGRGDQPPKRHSD